MRSFRDLLEVGMVCLDAGFKMQHFTKPKLYMILNLVNQIFSKFEMQKQTWMQ